jgi:hypothetical protein
MTAHTPHADVEEGSLTATDTPRVADGRAPNRGGSALVGVPPCWYESGPPFGPRIGGVFLLPMAAAALTGVMAWILGDERSIFVIAAMLQGFVFLGLLARVD